MAFTARLARSLSRQPSRSMPHESGLVSGKVSVVVMGLLSIQRGMVDREDMVNIKVLVIYFKLYPMYLKKSVSISLAVVLFG